MEVIDKMLGEPLIETREEEAVDDDRGNNSNICFPPSYRSLDIDHSTGTVDVGSVTKSSSFPPTLSTREDDSYAQRLLRNCQSVEKFVTRCAEDDGHASVAESADDVAVSPCEKITLNISGLRFETRQSTLDRFPSTLLGNQVRRDTFYDGVRGEYVFDRNRPSFDAILYYYQSSGRLRRPANVPIDIFINELDFYEIDADTIEKYRVEEGFLRDKPKPMPKSSFQRKVSLSSSLHVFSSEFALFYVVFLALQVFLS